MDIQMPHMNGYEATKAIHGGRNPLGKTIPIIAMTANAFSDDIQNSIAAGMDAHISKPIDVAILEKTMRGFLTPLPNPQHADERLRETFINGQPRPNTHKNGTRKPMAFAFRFYFHRVDFYLFLR